MKQTKILFILFILLIPSVFALYGGEKYTEHFDSCINLTINISATEIIDDGEYIILNNCTELSDDYWFCNCTDNYNLEMEFKENAVNNYTFFFEIWEMIDDTPTRRYARNSGGTSSRRSYSTRLIENTTNQTEPEPIIDSTIDPIIDLPTEPEIIKEKESKNYSFFIIAIITIIICIILAKVGKKIKEAKK